MIMRSDVSRGAFCFRIGSAPPLVYVVGNPLIKQEQFKFKGFFPKCLCKKIIWANLSLSDLLKLSNVNIELLIGYWPQKYPILLFITSLRILCCQSCQREVVHIQHCSSTGVLTGLLDSKIQIFIHITGFYLIIHISHLLFIMCIKLHSNHSLCADREIMRFGKWSDKRTMIETLK